MSRIFIFIFTLRNELIKRIQWLTKCIDHIEQFMAIFGVKCGKTFVKKKLLHRTMNETTYWTYDSHYVNHNSIAKREQNVGFIDRIRLPFYQVAQKLFGFFANIWIPIVFFIGWSNANQMKVECLTRKRFEGFIQSKHFTCFSYLNFTDIYQTHFVLIFVDNRSILFRRKEIREINWESLNRCIHYHTFTFFPIPERFVLDNTFLSKSPRKLAPIQTTQDNECPEVFCNALAFEDPIFWNRSTHSRH